MPGLVVRREDHRGGTASAGGRAALGRGHLRNTRPRPGKRHVAPEALSGGEWPREHRTGRVVWKGLWLLSIPASGGRASSQMWWAS